MKTRIWAGRLFLKFKSIRRWATVGITTALVDYFLFLSFYSITSSVLVANLISGMVAISFNYTAHYTWSFQSNSEHTRSGTRYFLNLVGVWTVSTTILKILITTGVDPKIAKVIPILITAPASYLSMNYFVFKKNNN
jgi:putative flippase GtrA